MKARECPYCHERISISECSRYILKGKYRSIQCDHCHKEVWPPQEPISLIVWVCSGVILGTFPINFFLYYMEFGFLKSLLCSLPIIAIVLILLMTIALQRMRFSQEL